MYFKPAVIHATPGETVKASIMIDSGDRKVYGAGALMFFSSRDSFCVDLEGARGWDIWTDECTDAPSPWLLGDAKQPRSGVMKFGTAVVNVGDTDSPTVYLVHQHPGSYVELKRGIVQRIKVEHLKIEVEQ